MIRKATEKDHDAVWTIFHAVIQTEDTYVFSRNTPRKDLNKHWFAAHMQTFVFEENGHVIGTYILKPNTIDLGSHVANASFMVQPGHQGKGIGKKLCTHSLDQARQAGYTAMQFNLVVGTNKPAIALWRSFGFTHIGTIPKAFKHNTHGLVDVLIMHKDLSS